MEYQSSNDKILIELPSYNTNIVYKTKLGSYNKISNDDLYDMKFYGASLLCAVTGVFLLFSGNPIGLVFAKIFLTTSVPLGATPSVIELLEENKDQKNLKIWNDFIINGKLVKNQYNFYNKDHSFNSIYNYLSELLSREYYSEIYLLNKKQCEFLMSPGNDFLDHIKLYFRNLIFMINYTHNISVNHNLFSKIIRSLELIILDTFYLDIYRYLRILNKKNNKKFLDNKVKIKEITYLDINISVINEYINEFIIAKTSYYKQEQLTSMFEYICKNYPTVSSDRLMDIMVYIISQSSLSDPYTHLWIISNFNIEYNNGGTDDYIFTTFKSAVDFITNKL